jgi:capsular polysaccharide biosynthesis protein
LGAFEWLRDWEDHERFGYTNGPALVDPATGWIVEDPARLLRHGRIDINSISPPSIIDYCRVRYRNNRVQDVGEVISLRDAAEMNYYHFLVDIIGGRLRLANELGLFPSIPVLVGRRVLEERRYVRDAIQLMGIHRDQIVIQENLPCSAKWIRSKRVYFADPPRQSLANLEYVRRVLRVPDSDRASERRIFLIREPTFGRGINNIEAVMQIAKRFGFEIVQTGDRSMEDQQEIFSASRYVVGIHGAGLTNLIFRKNAACSVLEIYPPSVKRPRFNFYFMAKALGFHHQFMLASATPQDATLNYKSNFDVDVDNLSLALEGMLANT